MLSRRRSLLAVVLLDPDACLQAERRSDEHVKPGGICEQWKIRRNVTYCDIRNKS